MVSNRPFRFSGLNTLSTHGVVAGLEPLDSAQPDAAVRQTVEATGARQNVETSRRVAVPIYGGRDGDQTAFVAIDQTQLLAQLVAAVVQPWLEEHTENAAEPNSIFGDVKRLIQAGQHANALASWGAIQTDWDTGEWIEIVGEVGVCGTAEWAMR